MLRFHSSWALVLIFGLLVVAAQAEEFRYHYVSLDNAVPSPSNQFFDPIAINNSGRVYGNLYGYGDTNCGITIAVYADGALTPLQPGITYAVNNKGTIGGSVFIDPINCIEQAALFHGNSVELIPPQPGEYTSSVIALNDPGTAVVLSRGANGVTYVLYSKGQTTPLDFGPTVTNPSVSGINNQGLISGTEGISVIDGAHGFRFDPRTGNVALFDPVSPDTIAWGVGINNRGNVLGYSFVIYPTPYHERIGVWDRYGHFKTYIYETINSSILLFNDSNQIVITFISSGAASGLSYLVPKPGVRLNLADLVENLPLGGNLSNIIGINNNGDMIGLGSGGSFLLARIGADGAASSTLADTALASSLSKGNGRQAIPPTVAAARATMRRYMLPLHELKSGHALP
jgi:hypothetical protein